MNQADTEVQVFNEKSPGFFCPKSVFFQWYLDRKPELPTPSLLIVLLYTDINFMAIS